MPSLQEIRAKLKAAEEKRNGGGKRGTGDKLVYPFWNMQDGDTAAIRFLPDADTENTFFWKERQVIKLKFPGVKGGNESKDVIVQVPCMEMWNETCPVLTEVRPWFNDASLESLARQYWKKRTYIFQGIVRDDPMNEGAEAPENLIRKFVMGPQVFGVIKQALLDPDMENIPTDYLDGTDFRINKGSKGGFANYDASNWARKESSLNEAELEAINKFGLVDLNEYLPKKPNPEELNAINEMFLASVEGDLYDPARWASFYKPYGLEYSGSSSTKPTPAITVDTVAQSTTAPIVESTTVTVEESLPFAAEETVKSEAPVETANAGEQSASDILEMIRNRG